MAALEATLFQAASVLTIASKKKKSKPQAKIPTFLFSKCSDK